MAEIEMTLPTVQFGNVKVRATPEELGIDSIANAGALGTATAVYLNLFSQGFKLGSSLDVVYDAPGKGLSAPVSASQEASGQGGQDTHERAVETLSEGLGGVTEVPDPHAPGGSQHYDPTEGIDLSDRSGEAPWDKKVDVPVKPWETGQAAPQAPSSDW